jgi:2'-5' RNA ligase
MALLLISYPRLTEGDFTCVERARQQYPALRHSPLPPHFTLVFPTSAVEPDTLADHVRAQLASWPPIPFVLRSSIPFKDASSADTSVLLMPDEGFGRIVRLHDALYTGVLAGELRLDLSFLPHVTVGYAPDPQLCKTVADALNRTDLAISGVIDRLDLIRKEGDIRTPVAVFPLGG